MKLRRPVALALAALTLPAALAACGTGPETEPADSTGRLHILASFYPLQFVAAEVAGDLGEVTNLTPPAADPHDLELSLAATREIETADVVVTLGGFQTAVDDAIAARRPAHVVDAATLVTLLDSDVTGALGHAHGDEHTDGDDHAHEHDEGEEEHAHDDAATDPHFWLDPTALAETARPIADALSEVAPEHAATFAANAEALVERLGVLDTQIAADLAPFEGATLITSHTAFGYLAHRYGLSQVGVTGLDHDVEASPARMREIGDLARRYGVTTLFSETLVSPDVIETLASDLGLRTAVLDTIESLGQDDADAGEDYVSIMQRNVTTLTEGLTTP